VTSPLKSLIATDFASVGVFHVPFEMMPEAPSPRRSETERSDQVMELRMGLSSAVGAQGFPANERKESSGIWKSHCGSSASLFAESRRSPSFRHADISVGREVSRLPANMHFCRRWQCPILFGNSKISLFVRMSQRNLRGKAPSGMVVM